MRSAAIRPDDPRAAELYARVVCSDDGCPAGRYMHRECFDSWERLVLAYMKNAAATYAGGGGGGRRIKDLWTVNVNVNNNNVVNMNQKGYEMAFKACGCRCGRGFLKKDSEWPSAAAVSRKHSSGCGGFADDADSGVGFGGGSGGSGGRTAAAGKKKKRRHPRTTAVPATVDYAELRLRASSLSGSSNGSSSPVTGSTTNSTGSSVSPAHSGSYGSAGSSASSKKRGAAAPGACAKDVFER